MIKFLWDYELVVRFIGWIVYLRLAESSFNFARNNTIHLVSTLSMPDIIPFLHYLLVHFGCLLCRFDMSR